MKKLLLPLSVLIIIFLSNLSLQASSLENGPTNLNCDVLGEPEDTIFLEIQPMSETELADLKEYFISENVQWLGYCAALNMVCLTSSTLSDQQMSGVAKMRLNAYTLYPSQPGSYNLNDECFTN